MNTLLEMSRSIELRIFWQRQPSHVIEKVVRHEARLAASLNRWHDVPVRAVSCDLCHRLLLW